MKVYLITSGSYSDYQVNGVCTTKEVAEEIIQKVNKKNNRFSDYGIEEYEILESSDDIRTYIIWNVYLDKDGNRLEDKEHSELIHQLGNERVDSYLLEDRSFNWINLLKNWPNQLEVFGAQSVRGKEVAYKIAQDKRAEYLAKQKGIS